MIVLPYWFWFYGEPRDPLLLSEYSILIKDTSTCDIELEMSFGGLTIVDRRSRNLAIFNKLKMPLDVGCKLESIVKVRAARARASLPVFRNLLIAF